MAEQTLPSPAAKLIKPDGLPDETWYQCFSRMWRAFTALNTTVGGKAAQSQTVCAAFTFRFPEDGGLYLINPNPFGWTIESVSTITTVGTATVIVGISGVALGGSSNSASVALQTQEHTTNNAVEEGDDVSVAFASTSADCENLTITIAGTRTLA